MTDIIQSIKTEVNAVKTNLNNIKLAIEAKGQTISGGPSTYATAISNISGGSSTITSGFLVQVVDYDGTVLKSDTLQTGDTFTLPNAPTHTGLTFQSWSSPVDITNNTITVANSDITIGPTYTTTSGLSEFDISLNATTGKSITFTMNGTKNWGDGTSDTATSHTYASYGDYTITCNGTTISTVSSGTSSVGLFGQTFSNYNSFLTHVRFSDNVSTIPNFALMCCYALTTITIPESVINIETCALYNNYALKSITIPKNVTSICSFDSCFSLKSIVIPKEAKSLESFLYCRSLKSITIPEGVTYVNLMLRNCDSLKSITFPGSMSDVFSGGMSSPEGYISNCASLSTIYLNNGITATAYQMFTGCPSITSISLPNTLTTISSSLFINCTNLIEFIIPDSVVSMGYSVLEDCPLITEVVFPRNLTTIESLFNNCYSLLKYDFTHCNSIPTLQNTSNSTINKQAKIYVPWNLWYSWKNATNWSSLSDMICVEHPATINFTTTPNNCDIYIEGNKINGTSTTWAGSTIQYFIHDTTNNVILQGSRTGILENDTINITEDLTTFSKVTISTEVSGLSVSANIGGVITSMVEETPGNYVLNIVGSGITISYLISGGSNYMDAQGTITLDGTDITENVSLLEATERSWTRPNLSSNGTLGGNSFAVLDPNSTTSNAWRAVDSSSSTYWNTSSGLGVYIFYNPNALKVSSIVNTYYNSSFTANKVTIQGSNDNNTWINITCSTTTGTTGTITLTNNNYYKYYKLTLTPSYNVIWLKNMVITATEKVAAN